MNTKYCKVIEGGASVEFAPDFIAPNWSTPTEAEYLAHGWIKNRIVDATPAEGYMVTGTRYEAQGDGVVAVYEYAPIPKAATRYSKLKIYGAIASLGKWSEVEAWLRGKDINGVNGWMAFELAQEVSDDHPLFAPLAAEAQALLGLTDEAFAALLAQCVLED